MAAMLIPIENQALERLLAPVSDCFTVEAALRLSALRSDEFTQQRLELLAERHSEDTLTAPEREEYEALVRAGLLVSVLQAQARRFLTDKSA
jgi:hypothetical protein